ncbi:pyrimidine 5'-nucleotidase [Oxalobacter vibrioformis]|uniref:Pyrimidine 5'-nucleotidase n=1 Tax=Oxalobacter vibrioformis TaxID=933080 RepID=A0A9E9M117_9BURK|nr:pyrimidine 5'-nucleotidase [Oxalobacter vibrioformis]WAW11260.1 pyrimidine 5'-nucleotidase [Oxalobacter vibrioformis]
MIWIFDLDNTLHDASHAVFPAITANMNAFIANHAGKPGEPVSTEAANALRLLYWKRYGATILGMIRHHGVKPEAFLDASHDLGDLSLMIRAERGLKRLMRRLPGKKILLTNAAYGYSRDVLRHLGLHRHFARHVSIESMQVHGQLLPKPSKKLFRKLLVSERIRPSQCVLVEDSDAVLKAGRAVGMRTALVTRYTGRDRSFGHASPRKKRTGQQNRPAFVDVKVPSIRQLPRYLKKFR